MTRFALPMAVASSRRLEQSMGTPWCREFRRAIFAKFPLVADDLVCGVVAVNTAAGGGNRGNVKANTWLRAMEQQLSLGPFNATWDDQALEDYALVKAERVAAELGRLGREADAALAQTRRRYCWQAPRPAGIRLAGLAYRPHTWPCRRDAELEALQEALRKAHDHCLDVDPPAELERLSRSQRATLLKKLSAAPWWRRKLRTEATRRVDQFHRLVRRVHKRAEIYLSDMAFDRWRSSQAASRAMLEATTAVNQFEHEVSLAELAQSGQANPKHRFAEMQLRVRQTEDFGRRAGHCGVFITWTLPSAYHAVLSRTGQANPKYTGATPREAHRMLCKLWARARAKLKRDGIECYGLRVVEPHHDGTPHWHLMLFVAADQLDALKAVIRRYALSIDPEEVAGREAVRIKFMDIDPAKGSAAAYVAKYIGKAIAGAAHPDDVDLYGKPMDVASERIVAWASVHGIRQFQFMGTPSVTVWRELRRLRDKEADPYAAASFADWVAITKPDPEALAILEDLRRAADAGDWYGYLDVMGGVGVPASERPARPWRLPRLDTQAPEIDPETGEQRDDIEKRGIYGEAVMTTFGVVVTSATGQAEFLTRFYRWEVKPGAAAQGQRSGEAAEPWTRDNNCTGPDIRPRTPPPEVAEQQQGRLDEWRSSTEYQANLADIEECIRLDREALEQLRAQRAITVPEYFPPELDGFDEPAPAAGPPEPARQNPVTPESKRAWRFLVSSACAEKRRAAGIDGDQAARLAWRFFEPPPTKQDRQAWAHLLVTANRGRLDAARALATAHALWEAPAPVEPFPHQQHA